MNREAKFGFEKRIVDRQKGSAESYQEECCISRSSILDFERSTFLSRMKMV